MVVVVEFLALVPKELWFALGSSAVTAAGFLFARWMRGEGITERLDRAAKTIDLRKKLRDENLSLGELAELERQYAGRRRDRTNIIESETAAELAGEFSPLHTQQAMNQVADADLEIALAELNKVKLQLGWLLLDGELEIYEEANSAWENYAHSQAEFEAVGWEGGSGYPLVYAASKRALVVRRIAELKSEIEARDQSKF